MTLQLPDAIRVAADRHHAERLYWQREHQPIDRPPCRGDLAIVDNGEGDRGVVLIVTEHDTHLNFLWTHSTTEMAYDADIILPPYTAALWPVVICTELYGQCYPQHVERIITHLDLGEPVDYDPKDQLGFVRVAAVYAERLGGQVGVQLGGVLDPRRQFMDELLDSANKFSVPVRLDLIGWAP